MTHSEIKIARSLSSNKYRKEHNAYLIEGVKIVSEWMSQCSSLRWVICTENFLRDNEPLLARHQDILRVVPYHTIEKISTLKTPPQIIAVADIPSPSHTNSINPSQPWHLVLDRIQDPGNLGTLIRLADWMGMKELVLSPGSVDIYNPKVLQSTMGSFLRVQVLEMELTEIIVQAGKPLIGTVLDGESILEFEQKKISSGCIFMGNESHGLPADIIAQMDYNITLPSLNSEAESLNVAIAASMICSRLIF